jgi:hypothetical protein
VAIGSSAHAAYLGVDHKYYHATYANGAWDNAGDRVGGAANQDIGQSAPAVASRQAELVVAFGGADSNLYARPWSSGAWQNATQIAPSVDNTIPPRIIALTGGGAELMVVWSRSGDHVLEYATRTSGTWSPAAILSSTSTLSPYTVSMVPLAGGGARLVYQGDNGKPYVCNYGGGAWSAPETLFRADNPRLASPPQAALGICGEDVEVVYVPLDGSLHVASMVGATVKDTALTTAGATTFAAIATAP